MSAPGTGESVLVVLHAARPIQCQAVLIAARENSIAVRVDGAPESWARGTAVSVIHGPRGQRYSAAAALVARTGDVLAFKLTTPWRPLDGRRAPRFETDLKAEVRSVLGNSRQEGRLIDISLGGGALLVPARPGGSQVELGLWTNGYGAHLLCEVVGATPHDEETLLHLRFKDLSPPQNAFIRQLIARLAEADSAAAS